MCFFKSRYSSEKYYGEKGYKNTVIKDKELIADNLKALDVIKCYTEKNAECIDKIENIKKEYEYISPSADPNIVKVDRKIADCLGDAKIICMKVERKENYDDIVDVMNDIRILIAER